MLTWVSGLVCWAHVVQTCTVYTVHYQALFRLDRALDEPIVRAVLLPKASIVHECKKAEKGRGSIIGATPLCYQVNLCLDVDRTLIKTLRM